MNCSIVINQQPSSLPISDRSTPETKVKDPERQLRGTKSHERYIQNHRKRI